MHERACRESVILPCSCWKCDVMVDDALPSYLTTMSR